MVDIWKESDLAHHSWVLDVLQLNTGNILLLELAATFHIRKGQRLRGLEKMEKSPKHGAEVGRVFHQNLPENHLLPT